MTASRPLLALLLVLFAGCMEPPAPARLPESPSDAPTPTGEGLSFLALGDSYTIGESVEERERWPVQLAARFRADGVPVADPVLVARTGWTTDELDAAINEAETDGRVRGPYDLVTLLIGVNNQYRGRAVDEYRAEFRALLARAAGFAGGQASRVVVVSIPDWGVTPFAEGRDRAEIAAAIDAFNAAGREEAARAGAAFVDITPVSRTRGATAVAADGLHPDGAMYAAWTNLALPAARAALGR